jgi:hypothetical protein
MDLLVGDAIEQMSDQVQPGASLVVGRDDVPRPKLKRAPSRSEPRRVECVGDCINESAPD